MRFIRQIPVVLLLLLPVLLVGTTVVYYTVNLPYWDDYLVQEQLQMMIQQPTWPERAAHLFDQHWEHRIVWTRLLFWIYYRLNGSLNYYGLTLIGVSGLFVLTGLLFAAFRKLRLPLIYFVPVPFWLCTLQSHENLIWAMASIQNFYVPVFVLGTFYALALNTRSGRFVAAGLATLAAFTGGNGILALMAGLCILILQRNTRPAIGWVLLMGTCLLGYFSNYSRINFFPSPFKYGYADWVKAFFVFLGGFLDPYPYSGSMAVGYQNPIWLTIGLGVLLAVAMGYFVITSPFRDWVGRQPVAFWDTFFTSTAFFLLATGALTVFSRVGFGGPGYLLQGRYKIYPALALSAVYLFSLHRWRANPLLNRYVTAVATTTILFSLFTSYLCLEGIINQQRRTVAAYANWLHAASRRNQRHAGFVYTPAQHPSYARDTTLLSNQPLLTTPATTRITNIDDRPFMYNMIATDAQNPTPDRPLDGSYILLKSPARSYVFAARPRRPAPLAISDFGHYFTPTTFYAQILKENLEPGRYRIGVLTHKANNRVVKMTDQYITFKGL